MDESLVSPLSSTHSASLESTLKDAPLAPFLSSVPLNYEDIEAELPSEHPERFAIIALCKKYGFSRFLALSLASQLPDETFEDEEEGVDGPGVVRMFIQKQHESFRFGTEFYRDEPSSASGVADLMKWGFHAEVAKELRASVPDGDWRAKPLSHWVSSFMGGDCQRLDVQFPYSADIFNEWYEAPHWPGIGMYNLINATHATSSNGDAGWDDLHEILTSNPAIATVVEDQQAAHNILYFHACSWANAVEVLQNPTYLPLRTYPGTQDVGGPNSESFYLNPSFKGALHWLFKNVYLRNDATGKEWGSQGAVLVFCVPKAKLEECTAVIDVDESDIWRDLVAKSRRCHFIERPEMRGLISGSQLANPSKVQRARTLEEAKTIATSHKPPQFQTVIKDHLTGRVFRGCLAGVVWHTREDEL